MHKSTKSKMENTPDFFDVEQLLEDELMAEYLFYAQDLVSSDSEPDSETEHETATIITPHVSNGREQTELSVAEKRKILDDLLTISKQNKLARGVITTTATKYGVHRTTISRLWNDAVKQKGTGVPINVQSKKVGKVGRKPIIFSEEWLQSVPLHKRTIVRSFAGALRVSPSLIYRLLKKGLLRSHTSSNHPAVTAAHKLQRMKWVLKHIEPSTPTQKPVFQSMHNVIHIDEKWFYLNPDTRRFYLLPREDDPYRCQQSKRYKIKAMFMGVVSRPIYDNEGKMIHDGKFGIFPFVKKVTAQKRSTNRERGTIETKPIQNINQAIIRDMLIQQIIPAIMANWPASLSKDIYIQQDNARPHIKPSDEEFTHAATQNGFNIQLIFQPPQSPDLNVLDLGFFRAIQALQYQSFPKNLDDLIEKVQDAYDFFDSEVLKYNWLQLQWVMVEILKCKGGNNFKNPHHGKRRLERQGLLPANVEVQQSVIEEAVKYLIKNDITVDDGMEYLEADMEMDAD